MTELTANAEFNILLSAARHNHALAIVVGIQGPHPCVTREMSARHQRKIEAAISAQRGGCVDTACRILRECV